MNNKKIEHNKWIECNLPYFAHPKEILEPTFADEEIIAKFGKIDHSDKERTIKSREKWNELFYNNNVDPWDYDHIIALSNNDPDIIWICEEDKLRDKIDKWKESHPKTKKYNKDKKMAEKESKNKSFIGLNLIQPGLVLDTETQWYDNEPIKKQIILFGDCDIDGSVAGDFHVFNHNTIVKRYKIINYKE